MLESVAGVYARRISTIRQGRTNSTTASDTNPAIIVHAPKLVGGREGRGSGFKGDLMVPLLYIKISVPDLPLALSLRVIVIRLVSAARAGALSALATV